jgi:signal transduction histidine kinase
MYGSIHDITSIRKYGELLNEILHDVSHVMRRPIASMLGLVSLMEKDGLDPEQLRNYMVHVKKVFSELDIFTRRLNKVYTEKRNESEEAGADADQR